MKKFFVYVIILIMLISTFKLNVFSDEPSSSEDSIGYPIDIETEDAYISIGRKNNIIVKLYGNNITFLQAVLKINSGDVYFVKAIGTDKYEYSKSIAISAGTYDKTLIESDGYEYFTVSLFAETEGDFSITIDSMAINMKSGQRIILYQESYSFDMMAIDSLEPSSEDNSSTESLSEDSSEDSSDESSKELSNESNFEQSDESSTAFISESSLENSCDVSKIKNKEKEKHVYDNVYFKISSLTIITSLMISIVIIVRKKKKRIKPD